MESTSLSRLNDLTLSVGGMVIDRLTLFRFTFLPVSISLLLLLIAALL